MVTVPTAVVDAVVDAVVGAVVDAVVGAVVAVLDAEVVSEATVATEAALSLLSEPCERSIMPTLGVTRAVAVSVSAEAATVLPEPEEPPPQAARAMVASVPNRALRIEEELARANCVM